MNRHSDNEPIEEELNRQLGRADAWLKQRLPRILLIAIAALVVLWLVSGIYIVNPGHIGVVRTFWQRNHSHRGWPSLPPPVALTEY
jgi:hypothetical protein